MTLGSRCLGPFWLLTLCCMLAGQSPAQENAVLRSEFIYQEAPFPSCHASTIVEREGALVAAWFGGTDEGEPDVGIWLAQRGATGWSIPVEVATGVVEGKRYPCWNPVLFQPSQGPLLLFYKVGPNPRSWWGMLMESTDGGKTWSKPRRLPDGILGPIRAKPVELESGRLLCGSSSEHAGWVVHVEWTDDLSRSWHKSGPLNDPKEFGAIQPTILDWPGPSVQMLCRSRQKRITELWSQDGGQSWGPMKATELANPSAGIDAVLLGDGRALLVYNPTERGRSPLSLAVSEDGRSWKQVLALEAEPGEYSYPAMIQAKSGPVHVTYTWKRKLIRHVVLDPAKL